MTSIEGASESKSTSKMVDKTHELRLEVDKQVTVKLVRGTAEVFGTELAPGKEYTFRSCKIAVFTWHGCELALTGETASCYIAKETPMAYYMNTHAALDTWRQKAQKEKKSLGPVAMVVGPSDVGKSTIARILLSYAVRAGWKPTFVDLDCGQNTITVPGVVAATSVEQSVGVENAEDLRDKSPLMYFCGAQPAAAATAGAQGPQTSLYEKAIDRLAALVHKRCLAVDFARPSGVLINASAWTEGTDHNLILHAAAAFQVNVLLVVGHEKMYSQLKADAKLAEMQLQIAHLPKSGGVVNRSPAYRREQHTTSIRKYFHGPDGDKVPHQKIVQFKDVNIFRVGGGPQAPSSALPIGGKRLVDPNNLLRVECTKDLLHQVLAVSYGNTEATLLESNVAGFVWVQAIDVQKQQLTLLAPAPGPLPSMHLLSAGCVKYFES